jgi:hypothetical protein
MFEGRLVLARPGVEAAEQELGLAMTGGQAPSLTEVGDVEAPPS